MSLEDTLTVLEDNLNIILDKYPSEYIFKCREMFEPIIYTYLQDTYGSIFDTFWINNPPPKESKYGIFITERRSHPNLWFLLRNLHYYCPNWQITIHCSNDNYEYLKSICYPHTDLIHLKIVFESDASPQQGKIEYNKHLKKLSTWESIESEHILCAETDTYLINKIPDDILTYDYVASVYSWKPSYPGGGGLSLRKKSTMLLICKIQDSSLHSDQDVYCSEGILNLVFTYAKFYETCFIESYESEYIAGLHQWWSFYKDFQHDKSLLKKILTCVLFE